MTNLSKRIEELFKNQKVIFWYDNDGLMIEQYNQLQINATKLTIDNNEFSIKYKVVNSHEDDKFLIYSPSCEPSASDNWLLGLQLKSYIFSADSVSLLMNDLGIDLDCKPFISRHFKFFDSKSRADGFLKLYTKEDSVRKMAIKMIAVLTKSSYDIENICIKLFASNNAFDDILKYQLESYFWDEIKKIYKYNCENPSIADFGYKLLQNHFYSYVDKTKCELNNEAVLFVKHWMDSSSNKNSYENISKTVEQDLIIENIVNEFDCDKLSICDTYEICEHKILKELGELCITESPNTEKIINLCQARIHTFWYKKYENIYKAYEYGTKLILFAKNLKIKIANFDDGITQYINHFSQADYFYRKYTIHSNRSENLQILQKLDAKIENIYLNDCLRVVNDNWQSHLSGYKASNINFQRNFFANNCESFLEKDQRIFIIISDALRYECAHELQVTINGINRYHAKLSPMIGVLPSFTQLGVASLLPNKKLSFDSKDDSVFVDGLSSKGSENRNKILKSKFAKSCYISSEDFLNLDKENGREFSKNHNLIYIYHNEIDATGDKRESETKVFEAVENTFETLQKIIKHIFNINGTNIFLTSDHGFLYQNTQTAESELCKVEKTEDANRFNRRFIIAKNIEKNNCIDIFNAKDLCIDDEIQIALAKSVNKMRMQGGGNRYVHGGGALQEIVVPLLQITKKRTDDVRHVEVSCLPISQITTNSVMLSFYQEEPIDDKIKPITIKIALFSKDGEQLSNAQIHAFDSVDSYDRNRETKLKFDLKSSASNYSGQTIVLKMKKLLDNSNEEITIKEYSIKLQLSFANDFDF